METPAATGHPLFGEDPPGRRWWAALACALLAALLAGGLGALSGMSRAAAPPAPAAASVPAASGQAAQEGPAADSGVLGPWQEMQHQASSAQEDAAAAAHPRGVLLLGDSIARRAHAELAAALGARGRPVSWNTWNGRPAHGCVDAFSGLLGAGRAPATVVMVCGTNDVFEPGALPAQIDRLMRLAGPTREIYWVTPQVARPRWAEADTANSRHLRTALAQGAQRHPRLHVVPWGEELAALPPGERDVLLPDGVHPSPAGARALSARVLSAVG